jgi:Fibronectin type III domain
MTMDVTWDPPPSPSAGSIAGYRIYYSMLALPADMDQWQSVDIGPYTVAEIQGLESHTAYAVRVRARSSDNRLSNFSEIAYTNRLEHG